PSTTGKGSVPVDERHRDPHAAARRLDRSANPAVGGSAVDERHDHIPLPDGIGGMPRRQDAEPHRSKPSPASFALLLPPPITLEGTGMPVSHARRQTKHEPSWPMTSRERTHITTRRPSVPLHARTGGTGGPCTSLACSSSAARACVGGHPHRVAGDAAPTGRLPETASQGEEFTKGRPWRDRSDIEGPRP